MVLSEEAPLQVLMGLAVVFNYFNSKLFLPVTITQPLAYGNAVVREFSRPNRKVKFRNLEFSFKGFPLPKSMVYNGKLSATGQIRSQCLPPSCLPFWR
jgi:hypothetical protein